MKAIVDHDSTMLTTTLPSVCSIIAVFLQRQSNSIDQGSTEEAPISRVPQTIVSVTDLQSDTTVTHVSCVGQDSNSVFWAGYSGEQEMLMSPKRSTVAPVPTTVPRFRNRHERRLTNFAVPAGITRPCFNNRVLVHLS